MIVRYYKKYIPLILLVFVLLVGQAYCDLMLPDKMAEMMTEVVSGAGTATVWKIGLVMLAYSAGVTVLSIVVGYLAARIGSGAGRDMREAVFNKISTFTSGEFDRFTTSSLITRSTNDIMQIQMFCIMVIRMVLYAPIIAVGGIIHAVEKSAGMNYLAWVIVGAVCVVVATIVTLLLIAQPKFMKLQKLMDRLNLVAREGLTGMMVVRAFNTQKREEERFDGVNKELTDTNIFVNRVMGALMPVIMMVMNGVTVAVVWIAAYNATNIEMVTNMMAFMQYAVQIVMAFMMVTMVFVMMPRALVANRRVVEVLKTEPKVVDRPDAVPAGNLTGELEFKNVSFSYGNGEAPAIENISFTARPGMTTAVIGATGSGKSTLVSLVPRLYDVSSGEILLDGKDIRTYTVASLRDNVAYVPQKNVLISGTIRSNIGYPEDAPDDERVVAAAGIAQADGFIDEKAEKYAEPIAQGGTNVSGGQKQRLAIARALYKQSPIYVFDDSFSALDFKTDANLRQALKDNLSDKNIIIVAQRVGSIMGADQIIVLDEGKMVGLGTHKELMQSCPVYRDIAESQLSKEELRHAS